MKYFMSGSTVIPYKGISPTLGDGTFVAAGSRLIGDLVTGSDVSFWFNVVVRADCNFIRIGDRTNIQDGSTIHVTNSLFSTTIGSNVTIGHNAVLHGCIIGDGTLIGMGAIVLDGAQIGKESIVAAGALVTPGKIFPPYSMIMGSPAKVVRLLSTEERSQLQASVIYYLEYKSNYYSLCQPEPLHS